ncbi:MAG: AAA family ATPase [Magnetococcales bacterium]|nr:AAA family ATPase [Magnetococcales bacterium]
MRIDRLLLTRYGHFTATDMDIAQQAPGMVVLLGQNEAGKSTLREAIGDLLFGIQERTTNNFIHRNDTLQIGAHLVSNRGEHLDFQRVKRRGNSVQDPQGRPLPDNLLQPFLDGADRSLFDTLFGLSQESLRTGGDQMLKAQGRLGEMIFGAAGGMRDLVTLLTGLNEEAKEIYTSRKRSSLPFYQSLDAWNNARRQVNQLLVGAEEWQQLQRDLAAAEQEQNRILDTSRLLQTERGRLERLRRIDPLWRELTTLQAELTQMATAPDLPEDAPARHRQATERLQRNRERRQERENDLLTARQEHQKLTINRPLLARADEINSLHEGRGAVIKARKDLPDLLGQQKRCGHRLENLARDLGQSWSAEEVMQRTPSGLTLEEVQRLIADWTRLDTEEQRTRERLLEAETELTHIQDKLATQQPPSDPTPLRLAIDQVHAMGDLPGRLERTRLTVASLERRLQESLERLPFWKGDAHQLARIPVPVAATVHRFEKEFETLIRRLERAGEHLAQATRQRDKIDHALAGFQADATMPTPETITLARQRRDLLWQKLHTFIAGGPWPQNDPPPTILAERYVREILAADLLADRRVMEAERLARYGSLQEELAQAQQEIAHAATELQTARQERDDHMTQWRQRWTFLAGEPGWPTEMSAWMVQREGVLRFLESLETARAEAHTLHQELEKSKLLLIQRLAPLLTVRDNAPDLATLMQHAQGILERLQREIDVWSGLHKERDRCQVLLTRENQRLAAIEQRQKKLQEQWLLTMKSLGLDDSVTVEAAGLALATWQNIRQEAEKWRDFEERVQGIRQEEKDYSRWVRSVAADVLPMDNNPGEESAILVTGQAIFDTLTLHREQAHRKKELEHHISRSTTIIQEADAEIALASAMLQTLRDQAGLPAEGDLATAIAQAERKRTLLRRIDDLTGRITTEADGATLDQALADMAGMDPEQIKREMDQLSRDLEALLPASSQAGERVQELRTRLAELTAGRGAAAANQDGNNALALLQQQAHRWMVLRTAAFLLGAGIDRYRQERQGPILERAGQLFGILTCGRFVGFHAEYDQKDTPILFGLRADKSTCPVTGMSDGTQDQLYLALRVAIIEAYGQRNEPLPFIADDLFVNFDDQRSAAGFDVLLQLARSTQILFLTHHHHLATLAEQRGGNRVTILQI